MNVVRKMESVIPEEFEAMEKDEHFNYELIDGIVMMSPSPSRVHQEISGNLYYVLRNVLKNTHCETLFEYDIKVNDDIFKPDVMVFCDKIFLLTNYM